MIFHNLILKNIHCFDKKIWITGLSKFLYRFGDRPRYILSKNIYRYSHVRVRFAPSPTGQLHIGGYRTALYNYCFAKSNNGKFIFRIEDTDEDRTISGAKESIYNDLKWCSIEPDESPFNPGIYGPYCQSERKQIYKDHLKILLEKDLAYKCFCSKERLTELRNTNNKHRISYDNKCRSLKSEEIQALQNNGTSYCIRFKILKHSEPFEDLIFGLRNMGENDENEGDFIIMKENGIATYHFANVVDDHLMKITHVIRGQELLHSTTKHISIYRAFQWDPPMFAHVPLFKNADGSKLSKRQNDISIQEMRNEGFSPLAILNFLTVTGGGYYRDKKSLLTLEQIIHALDIKHVGVNTATINKELLLLFSRLDLQKKLMDQNETEYLMKLLIKEINSSNKILDVEITEEYVLKVLQWCPVRAHKWKDLLSPDFDFIWEKISESFIDDEFSKLKFNPYPFLSSVYSSFKHETNFDGKEISQILKASEVDCNLSTKNAMFVMRITICGVKVGPPIGESMLLINQERSLERIKTAMKIAAERE